MQLLGDVHRLLAAQGREFRRLRAAPRRPVSGDAGRDRARGIAAAIELLARRPVGRIRLEAGRRLGLEIDIITGLARFWSLNACSCSAM